jgi:hypothetical protein
MSTPQGRVPIRIRDAVIADAEALGGLELEVARGRNRSGGIGLGVASGPGPQDHGLSAEALAARWAERLRGHDGDDSFVLFADDGDLVGFAQAGKSRDKDAMGAGELYALAVAWRGGLAVGEALIKATIMRLNDQGYTRATCWVPARELTAPTFVLHALIQSGFGPDVTDGSDGPMRRLLRPLRRAPRP